MGARRLGWRRDRAGDHASPSAVLRAVPVRHRHRAARRGQDHAVSRRVRRLGVRRPRGSTRSASRGVRPLGVPGGVPRGRRPRRGAPCSGTLVVSEGPRRRSPPQQPVRPDRQRAVRPHRQRHRVARRAHGDAASAAVHAGRASARRRRGADRRHRLLGLLSPDPRPGPRPDRGVRRLLRELRRARRPPDRLDPQPGRLRALRPVVRAE